MEYLFSFNDKFEIHDDIEVLKRMGMVLGEYIAPSHFILADFLEDTLE